MEAAILLLALSAPGQHPIKLDITLLRHELRPCGDGFRRGCGPGCYRCRSCDGLGPCYDYRHAFGYPWNPRHSRCAMPPGSDGRVAMIGQADRPLPPVVRTIDPNWQPPPWNPSKLPPVGEPLPAASPPAAVFSPAEVPPEMEFPPGAVTEGNLPPAR